MKTSVSAPPPAPAPVDPGKASLDYINAMADPALQEKLLGAEQQFRPQYTKLNLQEQEQYLRGVDGQAGVIDILSQVTPDLVKAQETADRLQRDADIRALQSQSGGYLSALKAANPEMFKQLDAARDMGGPTDFYGQMGKAITGAQQFGDVTFQPAQADIIEGAPRVNLQGYQATTGQGQGYQATTGTATEQAAAQPVSLQGFQAAQGQATMAGAAPQAQAALLGGAPTMQAVSAGAVPMVQQQGFQAERAAAPTLGAAPTVQQQGYQAAQMQAALLGAAPQVAAQGYNAAMAANVADIAAQQVQQGQLGQSLYQQALQAAPTSASETFRQRAAQMATSTGQLSPEELRNAQQATREAFTARGLDMSNQAIAAEAMSRAGAVRERQAQDIQQASALNQAYLADLGASRGFATGVYGQDLGLQQANQAAMLQAAQSNQGVAAQMSLANQSATNQAGQFGASAQNAAAMANAQQAAQFAMANQQAQMSAASANMAALNQAGQFGATAQNAAAMANADRAAQFALANQGILSQTGLANMSAGNQAAQFGAGAQNAAAMANAEQQARFALANQQAGMQAGQFNAQQASQFALANQQAQMQANMANQALLGQYGLSNQSAANQFGLANMQAAQEAAQFGASAANQGTLANQQAYLQQAAANQQAQQQMALANLQAQNQASQFGAQAFNQFGLANIDAQNAAAQFGASAANQGLMANQQVGIQAMMANQQARNAFAAMNQEAAINAQMANRAFGASQQQQNIANLGMLGQAQQGELAANRAFQNQLVGMYGAAFDPMSVVLGRPSGALGVGQGQQGLAANMMNTMGGQVFDPNAGVNLALQQNANLGNYQAATYGAQAGAQGAIAAGMMQGIGSAIGGFAGGGFVNPFAKKKPDNCWVAREVYGETNPRWMMFREWLVMKSPSWFKKLYFKHGEGFAAWLKNKPRIKNLIRKWMDSRINNYLYS